jgi:ADP-heptose:LPS heptosyltransferase
MQIKNRNLFRVTRFILFKLPWLFRFFAKFRRFQNRLLIIKTDAIGDYILFRNYIEILRQSEKYKDYRIDLLGNVLWKDIALKYDAGFLDRTYFIRRDELYESPLQTLKLGWRLFKNNYQVVLQPSSTRLFMTDGLAGLAAAKQTIGFESDNEGILPRYKIKTDKFYSQRLILPPEVYFEFERSRFFFQSILNAPVSINATSIPFAKTKNEGIVIFPGAGVFKRGWEPDKFVALIHKIRQQTAQPIILAGGPGETQIGDYITAKLPAGAVHNLTGQTSLIDLIELIGNAVLVIANETSAIHIAAATQTKSVCILGGGHFERFAPYPANMKNGPVCIFSKLQCFYCNWNCKFQIAGNDPFPCISILDVENVLAECLELLAEN